MIPGMFLSVPVPVLPRRQWDCARPQDSQASSGALEHYRRTMAGENLVLHMLSLVVIRIITFPPSVSPQKDWLEGKNW